MSHRSDEPAPWGTYTPGYRREKALTFLLGALLCLAGLWLLRTPLALAFTGQRTQADVVDAVKTKPGLPDQVLRSDTEIAAAAEPRDRSYTFWNEFRFRAADGQQVTVRATVGSALQPLEPILDADGLPSSETVWYDAAHPQTVVFPLVISTWFFPGMLAFLGALAMLIGAVLYYWADKPIALPHVP